MEPLTLRCLSQPRHATADLKLVGFKYKREDVGTGATLVATATNSPDLEVKDAQLIFGAVWRELEGQFGRAAR
jgi:hypothetical protein